MARTDKLGSARRFGARYGRTVKHRLAKIEKEQRNEKFISMGRLSASIAHEIRNPLGAISHAGQLLAESRTIHTNDSRLVEIIENQSNRINQIVRTRNSPRSPGINTFRNETTIAESSFKSA